MEYAILAGMPPVYGFTAQLFLYWFTPVKDLLGIDVPRFQYPHETLWYIFTHIHSANSLPVLVGGCVVVLLAAKSLKQHCERGEREEVSRGNYLRVGSEGEDEGRSYGTVKLTGGHPPAGSQSRFLQSPER
ncbi:unnamed protein product, partial [Symbiodinium microadriaticum]